MTDDLITHNQYAVSARGMRIAIGFPPMGSLSHDDALNLAAWIVVLTGKEERFKRIVEAIEADEGSV